MELEINDIIINYEVAGEGQPVILMHGWGQNISMMQPISDYLDNKYQVYNIDLPGFGESDEPPFAYTIDNYVLMLKEFIQLNNIVDPIIIGHSFGCRIALKYSVSSTNLKALILTGAAGIIDKKSLSYYFKVYTYKFFKLFKNVWFVKHYVEDMMSRSGSSDYQNSSDVMKGVLRNAVNEDLTPILRNIETPTLLVFGSEDDATPLWMGELMNKYIKNSKLVVFQGLSHYAYYEDQTRFNNEMTLFLESEVK